MNNKQDKGFTLVELLIVIVILGILATVTVFAVRGITDQGQESACETDQRTLQTAVETWYAQYGGESIPGDVETLANGQALPTEADTTAEALVAGGFLVDVPDEENWAFDSNGTGALVRGTSCPDPTTGTTGTGGG